MGGRQLQAFLSRLTLGRKGLLIVTIPLLFEIAFAGVVIALDRMARAEHEASVRAKEVTASAYRLLSLHVDAQTGIRGTEGQGASFYFTLPPAQEQQP
jgi:hypothetical protein